MAKRRASDVFVECLEAEGVKHVFGIPGEETLDLNESLSRSSIDFVPVRHEQGGAYMADVYGRLTGHAGVCLGTLGPGALNLVTAVADAYLDRAPLVALTGQGDLERMHKESHQYIDLLRVMRPITKWNARLSDANIIPEVVRKAFKVAEGEKPGATHIELPEDVMEAEIDAAPLPRRRTPRAEPQARELLKAADIVRGAINPVALAGNGVVRGGATPALREFVRATGIPVAETFMGKGLIPPDNPKALGSVGLQSGDYSMAGFDEADVVLAIGYDLVEHSPEHWNAGRDKKIICIDSRPRGDRRVLHARGRAAGRPLLHPHSPGRGVPPRAPPGRVNPAARGGAGPLRRRQGRRPLPRAAATRAVRDPSRRSAARTSSSPTWACTSSGSGGCSRPHEPNTVLIANGLAGMGFAVPAAVAAKLVHPDRNVVTVSGDGGFLMNCQELETAVRLKTPFVNVIWENSQYGSIVWKQDKKFGNHFGVDFTNPDFVKLADSFGMPAWRCGSASEFGERLRQALALDVPSLIVLPIDYSLDVAISEELGAETVAT